MGASRLLRVGSEVGWNHGGIRMWLKYLQEPSTFRFILLQQLFVLFNYNNDKKIQILKKWIFGKKLCKHPVYRTRSGEKYIRAKITECFLKTVLWSRLQLGLILYFYLQNIKFFTHRDFFDSKIFSEPDPFQLNWDYRRTNYRKWEKLHTV